MHCIDSARKSTSTSGVLEKSATLSLGHGRKFMTGVSVQAEAELFQQLVCSSQSSSSFKDNIWSHGTRVQNLWQCKLKQSFLNNWSARARAAGPSFAEVSSGNNDSNSFCEDSSWEKFICWDRTSEQYFPEFATIKLGKEVKIKWSATKQCVETAVCLYSRSRRLANTAVDSLSFYSAGHSSTCSVSSRAKKLWK